MSKERIIVDGQSFLGRTEEQERFREALRVVQQDRKLITRVIDWATEAKPPLPFVFLLHGEGGMGKTYLSKRLRDIAENEPPFKGNFTTLWLDWEKRRDLDYALKAPDAINPEKIFEHIYSVFRDESFGKYFLEYEEAVKTRFEAEEKISKALDETSERLEKYKILRDLGGKGIAWIIRSGIIGGISIPLPEEPTARVFQEIIGGGAETVAHIRELATKVARKTLNAREFDLFTLPHEKLAHSFADGVRKSATDKPIVLFLDTYEISDRVDIWVREVIKRSSPNLIWVITGRNNLSDSRKFGTTYFTGYRGEFPSERLRVFTLAEFSVENVLTYVADSVPERIINLDDAKTIHYATIGIPLAVQAATSIWKTGASIEDIRGNVQLPTKHDEIVKLMTERFLLHCFDDPAHTSDRQRIYSLALAYQPDPGLLKAIFEVNDLEAELSDLERRHSFIFLNEMKLHRSVQTFLHEYLSHKLRRSSGVIISIHELACNYLTSEILGIEEAQGFSLGILIENDRWKELSMGLIHHTFWRSPENGWAVFLPAFIAGLLFDKEFARACVETIKNIADFLSQREKYRLATVEKGLSNIGNTEHYFTMLKRLEQIIKDVTENKKRVRVIEYITFLQAQSLDQLGHYAEALIKYQDLEKSMSKEDDKFVVLVGDSIVDTATNFLNANPQRVNDFSVSKLILLLEKAIPFLEEKHMGYWALGRAFIAIQKDEDAQKALAKATEFNKQFAHPYYDLAVTERNRGNIEKAIEYCKQSASLSADNERAHGGLAYLYNYIGEYKLAEKQIESELNSLTFELPETYINLGIAKHNLGKFDEAQAHFHVVTKKLIETSLGASGWALVITGAIQPGLKIIKDAITRSHAAYDIPNIVDWTRMIAKSPNAPEGVDALIRLIENEPNLNKYFTSKHKIEA